MSYRWKPSSTDRERFRNLAVERDEVMKKHNATGGKTQGPIRSACRITFLRIDVDCEKLAVMAGEVVKHSHGATGQHTFSIRTPDCLVRIKGRNLYPYVIKHVPSEESRTNCTARFVSAIKG